MERATEDRLDDVGGVTTSPAYRGSAGERQQGETAERPVEVVQGLTIRLGAQRGRLHRARRAYRPAREHGDVGPLRAVDTGRQSGNVIWKPASRSLGEEERSSPVSRRCGSGYRAPRCRTGSWQQLEHQRQVDVDRPLELGEAVDHVLSGLEEETRRTPWRRSTSPSRSTICFSPSIVMRTVDRRVEVALVPGSRGDVVDLARELRRQQTLRSSPPGSAGSAGPRSRRREQTPVSAATP